LRRKKLSLQKFKHPKVKGISRLTHLLVKKSQQSKSRRKTRMAILEAMEWSRS
jgi:hypothetical protein